MLMATLFKGASRIKIGKTPKGEIEVKPEFDQTAFQTNIAAETQAHAL